MELAVSSHLSSVEFGNSFMKCKILRWKRLAQMWRDTKHKTNNLSFFKSSKIHLKEILELHCHILKTDNTMSMVPEKKILKGTIVTCLRRSL